MTSFNEKATESNAKIDGIAETDKTAANGFLIIAPRSSKLTAEESAEHLQTVPSVKDRLKPIDLPERIVTSANLTDTLFCATIGATLCSLAVMVFAALMPGAAAKPLLSIFDLGLATGISSFLIYAICYRWPIHLALILLVYQCLTGVTVGQLIIDNLCIWSGADPTAVIPLKVASTMVFTFLLGLLPAFSRPIYEACFESSACRNTPGYGMLSTWIADRQGNRLTFAKAWKRALLKSLGGFLYHWSSFRGGPQYKDTAEWLVAASQTARIKRRERPADQVKVADNKLLIRYRAFHALENALELDTSKYKARVIAKEDKRLARGKHLVHCFRIVFGWIFLASLVRIPQRLAQGCYEKSQIHDPVILTAIISMLFRVLETCGFVIAGTLVLYGIFVFCRPTHIEIGKSGLRFIGSFMPIWLRDPILPWAKVKRIGVELPKGKASIADHWLVFYANDGTRRRLRVGSIDTIAAREEILKAIERWGPDIPRDVDVIKILQAPCDYSYTELWLEALSAPPERERLEPLITGARLKNDQYHVSRMLGCGGQGTAYLVNDCVTGEKVVLKEFLLPVFVDVNIRRKALATFEQEARLLKELSHPQVVKLQDYFVEDHRAYLVLEHIDGPSLSDKVKQHGSLGEAEVRKLAEQMCSILEYLSTREPAVVHRDFTPDNLILTREGTLKLIDFNVAHQESSDGTTGTVVGKTPYMAPEQFRGTPCPQSDLYSMGATLYFLIVGEDPVPISCSDPIGMGAHISAELSSLVQKLTKPELSERLAGIAAVRKVLEIEIEYNLTQ